MCVRLCGYGRAVDVTQLEFVLGVLLGVLVLVWAGIVAFTVTTRAIHDVRRSMLAAAERVTARRARRGIAAGNLGRLLRNVPLAVVEAFAADTSAEPLAATAAARLAVARGRAQLILAAGTQTGSERARRRRISALRVLARASDPFAVVLLERAARGADAAVANAAVASLGSLPSRHAARALVGVLRTGDSAPRSRVAAQLETFPWPVDDLVAPLLEDSDAGARYWAAKLLARAPARYAEVARLASDDDPAVRAAAAPALATAGDFEPLRRLVEDDVSYVRVHALRALAGAGDDRVATTLAACLRDPDWWVRAAAKAALRHRGRSAVPALLPLLEDDDRFVRHGAAEVLQHIGVLDELLTGESPIDGTLLRRMCAAGEGHYASLALERVAPEHREELRLLMQR
jgi:HEAT repeat protein